MAGSSKKKLMDILNNDLMEPVLKELPVGQNVVGGEEDEGEDGDEDVGDVAGHVGFVFLLPCNMVRSFGFYCR